MREDNLKHRSSTHEGLSHLSYTIETIQRRTFYTYLHANLNGITSLSLTVTTSQCGLLMCSITSVCLSVRSLTDWSALDLIRQFGQYVIFTAEIEYNGEHISDTRTMLREIHYIYSRSLAVRYF